MLLPLQCLQVYSAGSMWRSQMLTCRFSHMLSILAPAKARHLISSCLWMPVDPLLPHLQRRHPKMSRTICQEDAWTLRASQRRSLLPGMTVSTEGLDRSALSGGTYTSGQLVTTRMPCSAEAPVLRSTSVHFLSSPSSRQSGRPSTLACRQARFTPHSQTHAASEHSSLGSVHR